MQTVCYVNDTYVTISKCALSALYYERCILGLNPGEGPAAGQSVLCSSTLSRDHGAGNQTLVFIYYTLTYTNFAQEVLSIFM